MARFIFDESEDLTFNSPQEMYEDYKKKKIKGVLDYQAEMLTEYIKDEFFNYSDVALELPTGSGKTLVGLLIAEYRRRKLKEKVVYVCPNNQLVNQVVKQANEDYDIPVVAFTGKRSNYSQDAISSYFDCSKIAVTNYSSIFNINSFFCEADVIIFDDAHSAEGYIANNWTLTINRKDDSDLFISISERLKDVIANNSYLRLTEDQNEGAEENWCDMVPRIKLDEISNDLFEIISPRVVDDSSKKYAWSNIKYNLEACNLYLSKNAIVIRPFIPPTKELESFINPKQRVYMSATLGVSGELERTIGVSKIKRLSLSENRIPSIGRRFFIFPNVKFEIENNFEIFSKIKEHTPRALILTESKKDSKKIIEKLKSESGATVYEIEDLKSSFDNFSIEDNAIAVLANRYDGLNMQDELCHFLILYGLPSTTGLQERFFTSKLSTAILFNERMKTRVTQAVGRCTRSTNDYAVVMIIGRELQTLMSPTGKSNLFSPELRAEMETGYAVSKQVESVEDLAQTATLGFNRDGEWNSIDTQIIKQRNKFRSNQDTHKYNEELIKSSKLEVDFQYCLWKQNYEEAIEKAIAIIDTLRSPELGGYKQYWNYEVASAYNKLFREGKGELNKIKANEYYDKASKHSNAITWFRNLKIDDSVEEDNTFESTISDIIDRLENNISSVSEGKRNSNFQKDSTDVINLLQDQDGVRFERGVEKLGKLLGYSTGNPKGKANPDPWWVLNSKYCIVTECKIYEGANKGISVDHARQSSTHPTWINNNRESLVLDSNANIINVLISNASQINEGVKEIVTDINYVNRDDLVRFAEKKLPIISEIIRKYTDQGDLLWRLETEKILSNNKLTPDDINKFLTSKKLADLTVI